MVMKKAHVKKSCAKDYVKQLRCNIKTMRQGRLTEVQTVFDAFEIKHFDQGDGCKIERKKNFLKSFF
jgi:hypothetical protein